MVFNRRSLYVVLGSATLLVLFNNCAGGNFEVVENASSVSDNGSQGIPGSGNVTTTTTLKPVKTTTTTTLKPTTTTTTTLKPGVTTTTLKPVVTTTTLTVVTTTTVKPVVTTTTTPLAQPGDSCKTHLPGIQWVPWGTSKYLSFESESGISIEPIESTTGNYKYDALMLSFIGSYVPAYTQPPTFSPVTESIEQTGLEIRVTDIKTGRVISLPNNQFFSNGIRFSRGNVQAKVSRSAYESLRQAGFGVASFAVFCKGQLMMRATQDLEYLSARMQDSKTALFYLPPSLYCPRVASIGGGGTGTQNGLRCTITPSESMPTVNPTELFVYIDGKHAPQFDKTNFQELKAHFTLTDVTGGAHTAQVVVRYKNGREEKTALSTFYGVYGARCTPEFKAQYPECN